MTISNLHELTRSLVNAGHGDSVVVFDNFGHSIYANVLLGLNKVTLHAAFDEESGGYIPATVDAFCLVIDESSGYATVADA